MVDMNGNEIKDLSKVKLSDEQIKEFARSISIADIHKYIEDNKEDYGKWLKKQKSIAK